MSVGETPPTAPLRAAVSLEALRENLALVRRKLAEGTELIACVKARNSELPRGAMRCWKRRRCACDPY